MSSIKTEFARHLRKESTPEEKIVWEMLRNRKYRNLKFRRQHVLEGFVVDFYCHEFRVAIELDGKVHLKQKEYDELRQEIIESKSIAIIRITNEELLRNRDIVYKKIDEAIK